MLSETAQDYLKHIYKVQIRKEGPATTTELAHRLQVSTAAVTNMLKRLSEKGYVNHNFYKGVTLTDSGTKVALEMLRHHRLLEVFLMRVLDYTWDEVHAEAELLEHRISERLEKKIWNFLNQPTHDPHGAPIPDEDLNLPERKLIRLDQAEIGQVVVLREIEPADPEMLRYLDEAGLVPQTEMRTLERAPFNGPMKVLVEGKEHMVWNELAACMFVEPLEMASPA